MKKQVSKKELQIVVLTIIFCQLVIDFIDELSYTRFFKNKVKLNCYICQFNIKK